MADINDLLNLFSEFSGNKADGVSQLHQSGSHRKYFRLEGNPSLIGVIGNDCAENEAFIYLSHHFAQKGVNVPQVLGVSADGMAYIQEDLGSLSLFDAISDGRATGVFSESEISLLSLAVRQLAVLHNAGSVGLDFSKCYPVAEFDLRSIMWDLNYFKYCFLKSTGLDFREDLLENDFEAFASYLLKCKSESFMHRDFQSRNVMIKDGQPWFIDFQGGRKGPFLYDLASFLWQAKANFPQTLRMRLINEYIDAAREFVDISPVRVFSQLRFFVLFRILQVLGAYGFRGYFEHKPHFLQSIPFAIANLKQLLDFNFGDYPYLDSILRRLVEEKSLSAPVPALCVKVVSFSYKKGLPYDPSGNGGGFVFDCRALPNPGRYREYKQYTGMDDPVAKFLEAHDEVGDFLLNCFSLVDASVVQYLSRGFSNLMVCFGCTGGQHRSVFCATQMAKHLAEKFPVKVVVAHREQNFEEVLSQDRL